MTKHVSLDWVCSIPGCENRKHYAKNLCRNCYHIQYKGRPLEKEREYQKKKFRKQTCMILREHDNIMKDDPEALTPTFLRELIIIDCNYDNM